MTVAEAVEEYSYALTGYSQKYQKWAMGMLIPFAAWCESENISLDTLKPSDVARFVEVRRGMKNPHTGKPVTTYTTNGYARCIKTFLTWCSKDIELSDVVSPKLPLRISLPKLEQKIIEVLTPDDIKAMFAACEKDLPQLVERDRAILSILLDTGIRASELVHLTLNNVHLSPQDSYLKVVGKGNKEREVGLGNKATVALRKYIRHRPNSQVQNVFLSRSHKPLTIDGLNQILYRLRDLAHINAGVSAHKWRHTYAINYLKNGGNLYKLSRLMGHTSTEVTSGYLRALKQSEARCGESVLDHLL